MLFKPRTEIAVILLAAAFAWIAVAQSPQPPGDVKPMRPSPEEPPSPPAEPLPPLDELIGQAMERNPDIGAARAEVQRAEAELRRTEMETIRQVTAQHRILSDLRRLADETRMRFKQALAPQAEIADASIRLAQAEADLAYLLGNPPMPPQSGPEEMPRMEEMPGGPHGLRPVPVRRIVRPVARVTRPQLSQETRERLQNTPPEPLKCDQCQLNELLPGLFEGVGLSVAIDPSVIPQLISLNLNGAATLEQWVKAISDTAGVVFLFRDYGIFVTRPERAERINAPAIPEDTPLYTEEGR